jgi:uridine kinase
MKPHIIGVAGPSSSGKTELARRLAAALAGAPVVTLDSYYRDMPHLPLEERAKSNFDCPAALEWELLHEHLKALSEGRPFEEPSYDFSQHARTAKTRLIEPAEFAVVEGLFVLHWPELRSLLDTRVYVHTEAEVCFNRRLERDVAERGRTPESVHWQYATTVRPGAETYIYPSRIFADVVVSGELPFDHSVAAVLKAARKG